MNDILAQHMNKIGTFCGTRDVPALTSKNIFLKYGFEQADVMVLFGGSILCGGDVLADAIRQGVAKKYIIVGGAGHTTETLRIKMQQQFPQIITSGLTEAEIFSDYIRFQYGLAPDFIEYKSTNCGNNITNLLALLREQGIDCHSIILSQDATMQRRMEAGLRKYCTTDTIIINYATYQATVITKDNCFTFEEDIWGMWDIERYISLLMGEIPRLSDNIDGYGPNGKNYIAHVEIPMEVREAFEVMKAEIGDFARIANPIFKTEL